MKTKELEAQITEMVENFQPNNFKQKAFEEIKATAAVLQKKRAHCALFFVYP